MQDSNLRPPVCKVDGGTGLAAKATLNSETCGAPVAQRIEQRFLIMVMRSRYSLVKW
jgi:hypothetical protein